MRKLNASEKKRFFNVMDHYYSEEEMQKLLNTVMYINDTNLTYGEYKEVLSKLSLKDRHTCSSLAIIYDLEQVFLIIDIINLELLEDLFKDYKNSLINMKLNTFFDNYTDLDFYCLKRSIEDDGKYTAPYLSNVEQELLINTIDYMEGSRDKILSKPSKRMGFQNEKIEKYY